MKQSYGIVRDSNGNLKIDGDPRNLDPFLQALLKRTERNSLGLWQYDYARDAQGLKRIRVLNSTTARAVDNLVAVSSILIDGNVTKLSYRKDVPAGQTFEIN